MGEARASSDDRKDESADVAEGYSDGGDGIAGQQDAEPRPIAPTPTLPSVSQVTAHRLTHWPYRSWCDECVEAFGNEWGHQHGDHPARSIPVISMDYLFLCDKGVFTRRELADSDVVESFVL